MRKMLIVLTALMALLVFTAAAAESQGMDAEMANEIFREYLSRTMDPEDEIGYSIIDLDITDEEIRCGSFEDDEYAALLLKAELTPADEAETPDGQFIVLLFSDHCQFDFFQGEEEKNYVRITMFGEPEMSGLFRAELPEDIYITVSGMMEFWALDMARANGLPIFDEEEPGLPAGGWVRDSIDGAFWMNGRAALEVIPEGDGYKVLIIWGSSATEQDEWTYSGYYNEETQELTAVHMIRDRVTFGEDEEETRETLIDTDCGTVFGLNGEGFLVITGAADEQLEGMAFEMVLPEDQPMEGLYADNQHTVESPEWVANLPAAQDANQLFVVAGIGMDKTTAYISMHQKSEDGTWYQILSTPGFVGKNGLCADEDHQEGCGQTPIGVYRFNKAFGIAADPGCAIPYIQVDEDTYWSGDPERQYNRMVDIKEVPDLVMDDSEHIVDYEYQYQYCLNISFNEDGTAGRGSAIFLHCFGPQKPWTGGCVAIPENIMRMVMMNVREDCVVVIDTLDNMGGGF